MTTDQPVELRVNVNSRRIAELESRISANMGVSDDVIQDFQERIASLEAETARIAAFVDLMHRGAYSGGPKPKRPVFRVIRGGRDF